MVTEKLGNYQNNKYTSIKNKEVEPVEPVQIHIYQSNTYRKGLSWLHFEGQHSSNKGDHSSNKSILSTEVTFRNGDRKIRQLSK